MPLSASKVDPHFGAALVIGAGGILVELLADVRCLLLPACRDEIEAALRSLKVFRLFDGYRGKPKSDVSAIVTAIEAVAAFATAHIEYVVEIDVNPLLTFGDNKGAVAVDSSNTRTAV